MKRRVTIPGKEKKDPGQQKWGGEKVKLGAEAPPPPSIGGAWRQFQTLEFQLFPILSFRSDFFFVWCC